MVRTIVHLQGVITTTSLKEGKQAGLDAGKRYVQDWQADYNAAVAGLAREKAALDSKKGTPEHGALALEYGKKADILIKAKEALDAGIRAYNALAEKSR